MTTGNQDLYLPGKDWSVDQPQQERNAREIELFTAGPKDFFTLIDHGALPTAANYKVGTFIRVGSKLYQQVAGAWVEFGAPMSGAAMSGAGGTINAGDYANRVTWSSFAYETGENYGTSGDDYFTIPTTGVYRISFGLTMSFGAAPTNNGAMEALVVKNSDVTNGTLMVDYGYPTTGKTFYMFGKTRDCSLTAGDIVAVYGREDTDASASVSSTDSQTFFSIQRLDN